MPRTASLRRGIQAVVEVTANGSDRAHVAVDETVTFDARHRDAHLRRGLAVDRALARRADFKLEGGYRSARSLLESASPPDALFVANEPMTVGALRALRELGRRVPDDVALVGFDDSPWTTLTSPQLTVVSQPAYELGRVAAELLAAANVARPARHIVVAGVRDTAMYRNGRQIAAKLLDVREADIEHWGHLIFKPPNFGAATPWHQDEAYWSVDLSYHAVGAWTPLDDTDVDNGCLWFVPGSHKGDVLRHRHLRDDPAVHILEFAEEVDVSTAVPIPLRAGGGSFHHPRTIHGARPNSTDRHRRAWANEYQLVPTKLDVPADRPWVKDGIDAMTERLAAHS